MATPMALNNVQFLVPVDGGVTKLQAVLPPAAWYSPHAFVIVSIYTFFSPLAASFRLFSVLFIAGTQNRKESFGRFLIFHRNLKTVVCCQILPLLYYFLLNDKSNIKSMYST